ncbi:thioredoxin [Loktanella sp. IMCC34160]|uniref:TlpA family protein disulfide reductase n=1 Tax=Loktanella sp. IMCC34160 TaxID=2510646 RepID=UPI00101D9CEF|nr:conjugal transfer protein TraF [Loktanella sp. IMCC34160]RYG89907.1 thioredoxin [Loktanella sp. IMCC34160]
MRLSRRTFLTSALALAGSSHSRASAEGAPTTGVGIIMVGASWCPVCKQAAPILALFAEQRGLPVLVATEDARPIPPFPAFVPAMGHPVAATVTAYPTTFVYSGVAGGIVGGFEGYGDPARYIGRLTALIEQAEALV